MTPEAKTKAQIKRILDEQKAYFFMPVSFGMGRHGIPDFVVCLNGRFLAIEAKAGKGKTTALQEREMTRIRAAGGIALVVYDDHAYYDTLVKTLTEMRNAPLF